MSSSEIKNSIYLFEKNERTKLHVEEKITIKELADRLNKNLKYKVIITDKNSKPLSLNKTVFSEVGIGGTIYLTSDKGIIDMLIRLGIEEESGDRRERFANLDKILSTIKKIS